MQDKLGTATNEKIIELFNKMKSGILVLKPRFQRNLVWNNSHKEAFIETILSGLPFPEVYFADGEIDLEKQIGTTLVVDGQQRLHTIYEYIMGSKELVLKKIPGFAELQNQQKIDFFDYIVVVRRLGRLNDEQIRDIFKRINSVQYALNAMEINNALYEGEFITVAKNISETNEFRSLGILNEDEFARMKDIEFILLIMTTIEIGGYFTEGKELEDYIKNYDDDYPNKEILFKSLMDVLVYIQGLDIKFDSLWLRKSTMFTLIVELTKFLKKYKKLPQSNDLINNLYDLEEKIIQNKNQDFTVNPYAKFYRYVFQQTTSRIGRNSRGELLEKTLEKLS